MLFYLTTIHQLKFYLAQGTRNLARLVQKFENCASHPHNMFLEIYFSFGIIGLLVFISFIITAIYNLYKYKYSYEMIVFLIVFFFPILPSGSILSMNLIYHISIFSILFIADYKLNKFNHV